MTLKQLRASLQEWTARKAKAVRLVARRKRQIRRKRTQRMTANGRAFLVREEGVVPYAYNDPAGHATFGVGHLLHHGPVTEKDRREWGTKANPKPMSFVMAVLAADLKKYEQAVRDATGRRLKAHRFDACVSLAFNVGVSGFTTSTVARKIRERKPQEAADAFLLWSKPSMLRPRRERERRLFLHGEYE